MLEPMGGMMHLQKAADRGFLAVVLFWLHGCLRKRCICLKNRRWGWCCRLLKNLTFLHIVYALGISSAFKVVWREKSSTICVIIAAKTSSSSGIGLPGETRSVVDWLRRLDRHGPRFVDAPLPACASVHGHALLFIVCRLCQTFGRDACLRQTPVVCNGICFCEIAPILARWAAHNARGDISFQ